MKILDNPLALIAALILLVMGTGCDRNANEASLPSNESAGKSSPQFVDVTEAKRLIAARQVTILDLRTPAEFDSGHISGARNVDFRAADFEQNIATLDKTTPYLVHCASGKRSQQALPLFQKRGFQFLYHLDGGIQAWENAGLPIEKR